MEYREKLKELGITLDKTGRQTCPKCSHLRKNKTEKCLAVTYKEDGVLYKCFNCDWSGVVFYRGKYELSKKVYYKPTPPKPAKKIDPLYTYFKKRGISKETLDKYEVSLNDKKEIVFPYYKYGELVNVKYRTNLGNGKKTFRQEKDTEKVFYGMDLVRDTDTLVICEGECFKGDTEILTPKGWVRLDEYNGEEVMQVSQDLKGEYVKPLAYIKKMYEGNFLNHVTRNGVLKATENHNIFYKNNKGEYYKKPFCEVPQGSKIPATINFSGKIKIDENLLRLLVAIQADGTLDKRKNGNTYIRFSVKKERKVLRLEQLLVKNGIKYTKTKQKSNEGYTFFGFTLNQAFKEYPVDWYNLDEKSISVILDELVHWDGNSVPDRNQIEYATKSIHNATFIQTLAHLSGYSSNIIKRENEYGKWFKVSILYGKKYFTLTNSITKEHYQGLVYCVQVPTGLILTRTNNKIAVTGNCDTLAFAEQGIMSVSIPQGAGEVKLDCFENCFQFLQQFKDFVIAVDNDSAGDKLKNTLLERLGKENCKVVNWRQYKDANEALMAGEDLHKFIDDAQTIMPDGLSFFVEKMDEIYSYNHDLDKAYYPTGWAEFDRLVKIRTGYLMVVTGYPSRGKSTFVDNLLVRLAKKHGLRHLMATFESTYGTQYNNFVELCAEMPAYKFIEQNGDIFAIWLEFINDHFIMFDLTKMWSIDEIIEKTELAVKKYGINTLVIDPYNRLSHSNAGQREDLYIGNMLSKLSMLAKKLNILIIFVAHPRKPDGEKMPSMYSISGSGDWYNMADYGIIVHRDRDEMTNMLLNTPIISIEKVKNHFLGRPSGGQILLHYDVDRRILL